MVIAETTIYLFLVVVSVSAIAVLVAFVEDKLNISLLEEAEDYLHSSRWFKLEETVRTLAMLFTSDKDKKRQLDYIDTHKTFEKRVNSIIQQELYLLDERDNLDVKSLSGTLTAEEELYLQEVEKELEGIGNNHWAVHQVFSSLYPQRPRGAWVREYWNLGEDELWEKQSTSCQEKGGCCARSCGCCKEPRRALNGHGGRSNSDKEMHCTSDCGCCIRFRGSHQIPVENCDMEPEADAVLI